MFRQILVATDLTPISRAAVARAHVLARQQHAHLHLLHVVPDPTRHPYVVDSVAIDWERLRAEACGAGRRALIAAVRRLGRDHRRTSVEARIGAPAPAILEYARRHAVDLIVLGSHGRGRLAAALLGNVTDAVVRGARCPVMIVRAAPARRTASAA